MRTQNEKYLRVLRLKWIRRKQNGKKYFKYFTIVFVWHVNNMVFLYLNLHLISLCTKFHFFVRKIFQLYYFILRNNLRVRFRPKIWEKSSKNQWISMNFISKKIEIWLYGKIELKKCWKLTNLNEFLIFIP